jgi:hypothetical protein
MIESQGQTGGFFPEDSEDHKSRGDPRNISGRADCQGAGPPESRDTVALTLGNWMFEAIAELMGHSVPSTDEPISGWVLSPDLFPKEGDRLRQNERTVKR